MKEGSADSAILYRYEELEWIVLII
jgi:hypothetical protein